MTRRQLLALTFDLLTDHLSVLHFTYFIVMSTYLSVNFPICTMTSYIVEFLYTGYME